MLKSAHGTFWKNVNSGKTVEEGSSRLTLERCPISKNMTAEAVSQRHPKWQISEEAKAELRTTMAGLASSMKDVKGTMDSFGEKMEVYVKNLEAKVTTGLRNEGIQRKTLVITRRRRCWWVSMSEDNEGEKVLRRADET